jgi:hypothetical protein
MSRSHDSLERLREALRQLAEDDAVDLIADARDRARKTAAKVIEDVMVDELLEAAARSSAPVPHHEAEPKDSRDAWWAYCVLAAEDAANVPAGLEGIEPKGTVEVLHEGELAALVSRVPADEYNDIRLRENLEDLAWVEQTARRHEAVLEAALVHAPIVPLRLCTIYLDVDGVRRLLREHAEALQRSLRKVDGCAEWGVKVFGDGAELEQELEPEVETDRPPQTERPGATYLVQRQRERKRAERASQLRARCAEAVHERISKLARSAISNPPQRPELHGRGMAMLLNGAYLIANEHVAELEAEVGELEAEWERHGFVIELTGPWPAYNFVSGAGVMP